MHSLTSYERATNDRRTIVQGLIIQNALTYTAYGGVIRFYVQSCRYVS